MSIASGTRFGPYQILALVGAGGMGEVYRAHDDRLGRDVALKVLPAAVCQDRDRLRRFEHEAKAVGALNHPNVVAIYDVGTEHGQPYLVSELLDGESLRQRLARGPLPARRAAEIGAYFAHGLAAAHARGILHRDLKPENLFLTRDGRAKILDFGIAKLTQRDAANLPDTPTVTSLEETAVGTITGTVGYMAPEQVRGLAVDQRSDLFALGAVLHEMLTGARAFKGDSHISSLTAIVELDPAELPDAVPPGLQRIVRRCLEKDPDARFQSARDLAFALDSLTGEGTVSTRVTPVRANRPFKLAIVSLASLVVGAALASGALTLWRPGTTDSRAGPVRRFSFQPPANAPMAGVLPTISPDGTRLVYVGRGATDVQLDVRLHVRRLDRLEVEPLAGTEGASSPFFSPDGQWIGFTADGKLKKVSVGGGGTLTIADLGPSGGIHGASWGPDGNILFTQTGSPIQSVSAEGGTPIPVTKIDEAAGEIDHHPPSHLPGGRAILFTIHVGPEVFRVAVRALVTGEQRTIVQDGFNPRYVATGHIVFGRGSALLAATFDPERLVITGPEVTLVEDVVTFPESAIAAYSIAADGTLAYVRAPSLAGRTLVWVDRTGKIESLAIPPRAYSVPSVSPDGQRLAVQITEGSRSDVWIYNLADGAGSRLGLEGVISRPQWTPDGAHLTFSARRGDERLLIRQAVEGSEPSEVLASSRRNNVWTGDWTPDGQTLAFVESPPTDIGDIKILRRPGGAVEPLIKGPANKGGPSFSPDGRWIAYRSDESGRDESYVRPFPGPGVARQISTEGSFLPRWSPAGGEVFFMSGRRMIAVPVQTTPTLDVGSPRVLFELPFPPAGAAGLGPPPWDVTPDGKRFIMCKPGAEELAPRAIHIVENWFEELKQRVRAGQ